MCLPVGHYATSQTLLSDWTSLHINLHEVFLFFTLAQSKNPALQKKIWNVVQSNIETVNCFELVVQAVPGRY